MVPQKRLVVIGGGSYAGASLLRWATSPPSVKVLTHNRIELAGLVSNNPDGVWNDLAAHTPEFEITGRGQASNLLRSANMVWIASRCDRHLNDLKHVLMFDVMVLCEKPIAPVSVEPALISELLASSNSHVKVGFQLPLHARFSYLRDRIGELNHLKRLRMTDLRQFDSSSWLAKRTDLDFSVPSGILAELGCHYVHTACRLLFGNNWSAQQVIVEKVQLSYTNQSGIDDSVQAWLRIAGVVVELELSWHSAIPDRIKQIAAYADNGKVIANILPPTWPMVSYQTQSDGREIMAEHTNQTPDDPTLRQLIALANLHSPGFAAMTSGDEAIEVLKVIGRMYDCAKTSGPERTFSA